MLDGVMAVSGNMHQDIVSDRISPSREDYLEAIFWLAREQGTARSRDIAARLSVTRPSVTTALRQLGSDGFVDYTPYSAVTLTGKGLRIAQSVVRRHAVLEDFLRRILGIEAAKADSLACVIEHSIDEETIEHFEAFMTFADSRKPDLSAWMSRWQSQP